MNKEQEYKSIYTEFKKLKKVTAVSFREHLQSLYPTIWQNDLQDKSIERRLKRILDKLILFDIATKKKVGKEYFYSLVQDGNLDETYSIANALDIKTKNSLYKTRESIISKINNTSNIYYINQENEDISNKEKIIKTLELAIEFKKYVKITHNQENIKVMPLKLALFDGYWYLIAYNNQYFTFRIKNINSAKVLKKHYKFKEKLELNKWHNRYHNPKAKPTKIKLFINKFVVSYFKERNLLKINDNSKYITPTQDGIEYDIFITDKWELLPTLMQWQIYVSILEVDGDIDMVSIYQEVLKEIKEKLPITKHDDKNSIIKDNTTIRKTITIKDDLFLNLQNKDIAKDYKSFSDMVSKGLELLLKERQKQKYKQAMLEASKDKLYLKDMQDIEDDFKFTDFEN